MTTIDQQAALLRAICQRPDDMQARLVYADWCEDNGQEARAEFVRVQVELSSLPPALPEIEGHAVEWNVNAGQPVNFAVLIRRDDAPSGPFIIRHQQRDDSFFESSPILIRSVEEYGQDRVKARCVFHECDTADWQRSQALRRRERKLLEAHGRWWVPPEVAKASGYQHGSWPFSQPRGEPWGFRNGFVESITTTTAAWLAHGPQIVAATPVRTVKLTDNQLERGGFSGGYWVGFDLSIPMKFYPSEQTALDALSAAAVVWARQQAGLD